MAKHDSPTIVLRELQKERWSSTKIPSRKTISDIYNKFLKTGSVIDRSKSGRPSMNDSQISEITDYFDENSSSSIRRASQDLSISCGKIQSVLKDMDYFPYKIKIHQKLEKEDLAHRKSMAEEFIMKNLEDPSFIQRIIFSDESTFRLDGIVNRHNCRIWGKEPPNDFTVKNQSSPKINVWMGLSASTIYGPFFFTGNLIGFCILLIFHRKCEFRKLPGYDKKQISKRNKPIGSAKCIFPTRWSTSTLRKKGSKFFG